MTSRHRRPPALLAAIGIALIVAACSGSGGAPSWTFGPGFSGAPAASAVAAAPSGSPATQAPSTAPSVAPSAQPSAGPTAWTLVGQKACPESRFECITLAVPKDHAAAPGGLTWDVTFAIQRAAKTRLGTFVVITGGPGSSGIASADGYTDAYAEAITDAYDIVFIDQRGIGQSGPIQCIDAAAAYYRSSARPQLAAERDAAAAAAKTFATDCISEARVAPADLPLYATPQAVEDLEAIRQYLGIDKMHLYGESYGTQFVQYYAAAHPDNVAALFVDGPVDLVVDGVTYYVEATRSADDTLVSLLAACTADESCAADVAGGDALAAYDAMAKDLVDGALEFDFTKADGTVERRLLAATDLENAAFGYIYSRTDRLVFQRALAAASNGNLTPLARVAYDSIGIDPDTLVAEEDPTWSDALYYAVECQDYTFFADGGDPDARFDAWVAASASAGIDDARLATSFFGDTPCLYWPSTPAVDDHPAPLADTPYPVFVLASTTDPATPIANGMRIYSRLADGWFVQELGGPHVIFGWGDACPDELMTAFLADGTLPATRITTCDGDIADPYVPIPPMTAAGYRNALDLMGSTDDHILTTDDYLFRYEAEEPLAIGCDFGGTLTYAPTDTGTALTLESCAFTPGVPLTGTGSTDDEAGTMSLVLRSGADRLRYERDEDGGRSVRGRYDGERVDQEAAA